MAEQMKISSYIHPISQFGRIGRIHTVFPYSFNLQVNEQLINVSSYFDYLASYGLYLPINAFQKLAPFVEVDDFVKITEEELIFYSQKGIYHLSLEGISLSPLKIKALSLDEGDLLRLKAILDKEKLEEKLGLPIDKETLIVFEEMRQAQPNWQKIVPYLVGRGGGGTPSGDDILVAYLALLYVVDEQEQLTLLVKALSGELATPDVSRAYLLAAMQGFVNSLIYELLQMLPKLHSKDLETQVKRLIAIGHTSGKDMSYGLLLGIERQVK